jgi:hypothetical protein
MARARNIKPGFFKNEVLGVADPLYSLLFEGLWVLADRAGKLEDRPLRIKGEIFPYRDGLNISAMLDWLHNNGFIRRYEVASKKYILVLEFVKHQNPHKNESESEIPDPEEIGTFTEIIGSARADSLSSDSGFRIPSTLITDPGILIPEEVPKGTLFAPPPAEDAPAQKKPAAKKPPKEPSPTAETWSAYSAAYMDRYRVGPVRNAMVNSQLSQLVGRIGAAEAPFVAAWYVTHQNRFYVEKGHSVALLLMDCEKLRTEWATGQQRTSTQAMLADRTQTNFSAFAPLIAEAQAKERNDAVN